MASVGVFARGVANAPFLCSVCLEVCALGCVGERWRVHQERWERAISKILARAADAVLGRRRLRVAYLSGEAHTAGHRYRVLNHAAAAEQLGAATTVAPVERVHQEIEAFGRADLVIVWRAAWDARVERVFEAARAAGAQVIFDIDDLIFEPDLARAEFIDGLRSQGAEEAAARAFFERMEKTMLAADLCTAATPLLADRMARRGKPSTVLANGFDADVLRRSRAAAKRWRMRPADGLVRIGYAAGTRTHQRDFAEVAEPLAAILRAHPECRLVLFTAADGPLVILDEFPSLAGLAHQIEWRGHAPLEDLPKELARFDVNLAPLQVGNLFCEAKSELKFYEAALVERPTIASPTEPFRRAIQHERSGFLAATPDAWREGLERLVSDAGLRRSIGAAAFRSARRVYGPERRRREVGALLREVSGGRGRLRLGE